MYMYLCVVMGFSKVKEIINKGNKMLVFISGESGSGWMMNRLKDGSKFYFNTNTKEYKWSRPDGVVKDHGQLNKEEIQVRYTGVCDKTG